MEDAGRDPLGLFTWSEGLSGTDGGTRHGMALVYACAQQGILPVGIDSTSTLDVVG